MRRLPSVLVPSVLVPVMVVPVVLVSVVLAGCNGAIWGNVSVLLITCGIFFGTLTLGRRLGTERTAPDKVDQSRM